MLYGEAPSFRFSSRPSRDSADFNHIVQFRACLLLDALRAADLRSYAPVIGNVNENTAPPAGSFCARISPPWSSMIFLQMESPSPEP